MRIVHQKAISLTLAVLLVAGGLSGLFVGGNQAHASFTSGTGTMSDPYLIASAAQLGNVRNHLGAGIYFKLTADIDLQNQAWVPIGDYSDGYLRFSGHLDGNGFKIMNIAISRSTDEESGHYVGLFGLIGTGSTISNLILEHVTVAGRKYVGGLVGYNQGTISNSSVIGVGAVTGRSDVGGLAGANFGTVNTSYAAISVVGINDHISADGFRQYTGGLVGANDHIISNSYATGSVTGISGIGGLVGMNSGFGGTISNSYATGRVTGTEFLGGLLGRYSGTVSVNNSYYDSDTTEQTDVGKGEGKLTSEMQAEDTFDGWNFDSMWYLSPNQYPQLWGSLAQGTNGGTTKLLQFKSDMEYEINGLGFNPISGSSHDNISASAGDTITVRVAAHPATTITMHVTEEHIKEAVIATAAIAGVTVPVRGEAPTATIPDTTEYTAELTWSPADAAFAASTGYTATITITPKAGYTLTGVGENFFTVAGATTTTHAADSGVVTAVFPATEAAVIATAAIAGVAAPVRGETPTATIPDTAEYTAELTWSPADAAFAGGVAYTATITITPKAGYTLTGVGENFFTVAGATTTTHAADSGVVTAVFPATEAAVIATAAIAGVAAPVRGETPTATIPDTAEYTAELTWSPADAAFAGGVAYTATITITPKAGYTLTGVGENFFTIAGATTTTHAADSGVVTAVFPATEALSAAATLTSTIGTVSTGGTTNETITNIPNATTLSALKAAITPATNATFEVYDADGITVATALSTGQKVIVTAEDGATRVTYTMTVNAASRGGGSSTPMPTPGDKVTSTDGKLTLSAGQAGEVSLGDEITISVPMDESGKELIVTIEKVGDTQQLFTRNEVLISPVFEVLKNFSENFTTPVTLTFVFDLAIVKNNQRVAIFY